MKKILLVLGPTAVGKTQFLTDIGHHFGAIIYADTACLYKDLSIGVAKPSLQDQRCLPHYMIDLLDIHESFDVARFVQQTDNICQELHQRQQVPILSGGTLFYIQNFLFGISSAPRASKDARDYWQNYSEKYGNDSLLEKLWSYDAITASRLHRNDQYRIRRALEVWYDTGNPLSFYVRPNVPRQMYDWFILVLEREREELYQRINNRVEQMFDNGLCLEVEHLIACGATSKTPAMQSIGYREFFLGINDTKMLKECIKQNTRHYAKRQMTFLQKYPKTYICHPDDKKIAIEKIVAWLHNT